MIVIRKRIEYDPLTEQGELVKETIRSIIKEGGKQIREYLYTTEGKTDAEIDEMIVIKSVRSKKIGLSALEGMIVVYGEKSRNRANKMRGL